MKKSCTGCGVWEEPVEFLQSLAARVIMVGHVQKQQAGDGRSS
jgi:hypothetical protein